MIQNTNRQIVESRYAEAAKAREAELCCPVSYDPQYLKRIPEEVIEKDYGCGDPSQWVQSGDTVLDLGSGTGKICFIASQIVGPTGKVIGVDMTDDMLEVARRNAPIVAKEIGYANVDFRKGRIEDLALDFDRLQSELERRPVADVHAYTELEGVLRDLRKHQPMVADDSVDAVLSNCVLNLVDNQLKPQLFREIFRVLRKGGRAIISDIVSDEPVPQSLQEDADLWSGCISGAMTETAFLEAFEDAGFHGIELVKFETEPWRTVAGIQFRSVTVRAWKGKQGPCYEHNQAVIYKGPYGEVRDDDGHVYPRGVRMAVCDKTFRLLQSGPYRNDFAFIEPINAIAPDEARPFACATAARRHPRQTKGEDFDATTEAGSSCTDAGCC